MNTNTNDFLCGILIFFFVSLSGLVLMAYYELAKRNQELERKVHRFYNVEDKRDRSKDEKREGLDLQRSLIYRKAINVLQKISML
jgi:hypothetical protein